MQLALFPPLDTVIVAVPEPIAVTYPFLLTEATEESELHHFNAVTVALSGIIMAVSWHPLEVSSERLELFSFTSVIQAAGTVVGSG